MPLRDCPAPPASDDAVLLDRLSNISTPSYVPEVGADRSMAPLPVKETEQLSAKYMKTPWPVMRAFPDAERPHELPPPDLKIYLPGFITIELPPCRLSDPQ